MGLLLIFIPSFFVLKNRIDCRKTKGIGAFGIQRIEASISICPLDSIEVEKSGHRIGTMARDSLYHIQNISVSVITEAVTHYILRVLAALRNELWGKEVMDIDKGLWDLIIPP